MKIFFYFLQYIFIKILFIFLKILPLNFSKKLSSLIFRIAGKFSNADKTAINNCKFVFPKLEDIKIRNIIDESWNNIGINISELLKFDKVLKKNKVVLKGLINIENLIKNKKQAIFISIHQSNWEVLVPMLDRLGLKIGGIYRHINNFFLDKLILNIRKNTLMSNQNFYTPKGKQSAKDLVGALNNNFSIVLLVDQKDSAGEKVPFFNKDVKTQIGFLKIARKFNLPIVPIKNTRLKNGQIELNFLEPIYHNDKKINDIIMMEKIHKLIENWITRNPSQWFWQHKRFN
tara:strand:+ start:1130 stop:1993 length:864 start_codon:yes stop_codon:yes gene_type:complete